jgi:hypothetical protein
MLRDESIRLTIGPNCDQTVGTPDNYDPAQPMLNTT